MKKVAALQTQKGPWSRDMSSTVRKGMTAPVAGDGSRQKKVLALQQQKGPWSRRQSVDSLAQAQAHLQIQSQGQGQGQGHHSPPSPSSIKQNSKHNKMQALQEQKGPWNRPQPPSHPQQEEGGSIPPSPNSSPRGSGRRRDHVDSNNDFMEFDSNSSQSSSPPSPRKKTSSSRRPTFPTSSRTSSIQSPQQIICLTTAIGLLRQQQVVSLWSSAARYFNMWRRNAVFVEMLEAKPSLNAKEKTEHSVLLWLANNSRKKNLQYAWKKWMYAVIALQNIDKNRAIENLSDALAKENEQYKMKLTDIMQKVKNRDSFYRHSAVKSTVASFMRIKGKLALKRRFDQWNRVTWQMSYDQVLRREKFKMEIGFQAINSEKEVLKETEVYSARLEATLLCLLAFQNWKLKMKEDQYQESHKKWAEEKKIIQDNLTSLQKSLMGLNKAERDMVEVARVRGLEMYASLYSISDKLSKCSSRTSTLQSGTGGSTGSTGGILKKPKKLLFEEVK